MPDNPTPDPEGGEPGEEWFYVIVSRSHDAALAGWTTQGAYPDRDTAERYAASMERASIWIDGEDVTEKARRSPSSFPRPRS